MFSIMFIWSHAVFDYYCVYMTYHDVKHNKTVLLTGEHLSTVLNRSTKVKYSVAVSLV